MVGTDVGDHLGGGRHAVGAVDLPEVVGGVAGVGVDALLDLVTGGIVLVATDQLVDLTVEGGREQHRLTVGRALVEQALHLVDEPHVGHAISLVEDHHLDGVEEDEALVDQVGETARAGDDDVDPASEGLGLLGEGDAAVDGFDARRIVHAAGELTDLGADLRGELTGGHEDEASGVTRRGVAEVGDERDSEGEGLARSGRGTTAHVTAAEEVRERCGLDGEGARDVSAVEVRDHERGHAEIGEGGGHRGTAFSWWGNRDVGARRGGGLTNTKTTSLEPDRLTTRSAPYHRLRTTT